MMAYHLDAGCWTFGRREKVVLTFIFFDDTTVLRPYWRCCLSLDYFQLYALGFLSEASAKLRVEFSALRLLAFISEFCQVTVKAEASD